MKSLNLFTYIIYFFILINVIFCQKQNIEVTTEIEEIIVDQNSASKEFNITISPSCKSTFKFIHIVSTPHLNKCLLYFSTKDTYPRSTVFDISATNEGKNEIYVPRTYFESISNNFFYMNSYCEGFCNYTITFQLVEMIHIERGFRLDFLTFDYEEYLIRFEKNENEDSKIMIAASGGAKGHHGSRNNVKLSLSYINEEDNTIIPIEVTSDIMFNGAGTTFFEKNVIKSGKGYYLARVRGPTNTFVNFMVSQIDQHNNLPIDGKAFYGFLQGDDIAKFELTGYKNNINKNQTIQISIVVKGDLVMYKSPDIDCDNNLDETEKYNIKDELQALVIFNREDSDETKTYICIQGENIRSRKNAFIIEIHDVTDQKTETIVTEPLVNGYLYTDILKLNEVRSYRHSKYLETGLTKYNCKLNEGNIKVSLVKCPSFPTCRLNKDIIEGRSPHQTITSNILTPIDNYYTTNVDKKYETNANGPVQYLLAVLCLTEKCTYEVSFSDEEDSLLLREDSRIAHYISPDSTNYYHFKISDFDNANKVFVYLRTFSGDANIDVIDDPTERKRYYLENTQILEFSKYEYTGLYTLNVTSSIPSFYLLSFSVLRNDETEENKIFDIGLGVSFIDGIKNGTNSKKFKMHIDKTRGKNLKYIATFNAINCNIGVHFYNDVVTSINGIFQHEIEIDTETYDKDHLEYKVDFISFNDDSTYENKFCLFHITAQEASSKAEAIISEGISTGFALTPKTNDVGFIYPHSANKSDILIKYNLENSYLVRMIIKINTVPQKELLFSRSSSHVIPYNTIKNACPEDDQVCGINIHFITHESSTDSTIPLTFIIKSKDYTPSTLVKNKLQVDLVAENTIQYYIVDISPEDKGEVVLNFKKGSGIMFAKMVGKDADPEENPNWNSRVRLPTPEEKEESVGEFDRYKNNIKFDASKLFKYGIPVCNNGCELYIGVKSTDIINKNKEQNDYLI